MLLALTSGGCQQRLHRMVLVTCQRVSPIKITGLKIASKKAIDKLYLSAFCRCCHFQCIVKAPRCWYSGLWLLVHLLTAY